MTEKEWLTAAKAWPMIELIEDSGREVSERKFRLFSVACCRRIWDALTDPRSRRSVEMAELYADGFASRDECVAASDEAFQVELDTIRPWPRPNRAYSAAAFAAHVAALHEDHRDWQSAYGAVQTVTDLAGYPPTPANEVARLTARNAEDQIQAHLFRDIFGNPFRPVELDPSWLTSTVVALARQMYESRDFSPMPILADALQDAGCEQADILDHCRGDGPHVRGCWVVDLVLGKS